MTSTARRVQMRGTRALGLLTCLAVAGSWYAASSAFAVGEPTTVPTITAPTDGATVGGNVAIVASSTAPSVQFYLDAAPFGSPVTVASGTATTPWATWGLPNGTSRAWTAADCNAMGCNTTQSSAVTVTVTNAAPVLTAPANGATTDRSLTLGATAAGGGIAFFVDGTKVGFDGSSPFSFAVAGPLAEGAHTATVQSCDVGGTSCNGPTDGAGFTVAALHPKITSLSPDPFSPNNDGQRDRVTFRVQLSGSQNLVFSVENGNGQTIAGPYNRGVVGSGTHTYRWNGRNNAGSTARDGTYTVVVATSARRGTATIHGVARRSVRVDRSGPRFSGLSGAGSAVYPVPDGYQDTFRPRVSVSEGGRLWLVILNRSGAKVRQLARTHARKGTFEFRWNGRNKRGSVVPVGTYRFRFRAEDAAGNQTLSRRYSVRVRPERLVNKAATLRHQGDDGLIQSTDWSCTQYDYTSNFDHGVWINNVCNPSYSDEAIWAQYDFTVPGAIRYNRLTVRAYGTPVIDAPEPVASTAYSFSRGEHIGVGAVILTANQNPRWSTFGTVSAKGLVSSARRVRVTVGLPNTVYLTDYDIGAVEITISFSVLQ